MATKKPVAEKPVAKPTSTAVMSWQDRMAQEAKVAAGMEESTATGQFFSLKSGVLAFNDAPLPGNEMGVIILDGVLENVFYEGAYDPDTPQGPSCFAFGREEKTMAPHKIVIENNSSQAGASGLCEGCEMNEWGSAAIGKGKACRNVRRLAMIPAGTIENGRFKAFTEGDHFETAGIGFMKVPVMSVKGYAAFVKQVAGALNRPPFAIFTRVKVVPDDKSQFRVVFEPISQVPDELMDIILRRHDEARLAIESPYTPYDESTAPPPPPKRGLKAQQPAKKVGRKY